MRRETRVRSGGRATVAHAGSEATSARLAALKDLPQLRDTAAPKREALFEQKLQDSRLICEKRHNVLVLFGGGHFIINVPDTLL